MKKETEGNGITRVKEGNGKRRIEGRFVQKINGVIINIQK